MGHDSRELDFSRLRERRREKPRTKAGQVRQAWPEIRELIVAGHSLKDIWIWLNEIGIDIGYARLSHYVGQLRRKEDAAPRTSRQPVGDERTAPGVGSQRNSDASAASVDPLKNLRQLEQNRPGFNYTTDLDLRKLIGE